MLEVLLDFFTHSAANFNVWPASCVMRSETDI